MIRYFTLLCSSLLLIGCENQQKDKNLDDLNAIKKDFLHSILGEEVNESPFHIHYTLRTIFFSKDVVSLFGEIHVYDHLPHGWGRYEGRTFCKIHGQFCEIKLEDLFSTASQKEFLRQYCENNLKSEQISYFSDEKPLCSMLEYEDIGSFVIDDKFLIVFFQPYVVGGLGDGPIHVKIPYEHLTSQWNSTNLLFPLLSNVISSKSYTASWEETDYLNVANE